LTFTISLQTLLLLLHERDLNEAKALEAKQRAEAAMEDATENQDISATQAALAESMAQLQMISKIRNKKN
jgi:F-type H+-transporting ATPase subunit epsilon